MKCKKIFITAIDTNVGKTIFTGILGKFLLKNNKNIITHKIVQTGSVNISDDIITHRKIMNLELLKEDIEGITCPYIFKFPASPHLSSFLEKKIIDPQKIINSINILEENYEYLLIEGVGGIMVPLNENYTVLDFIKIQKLNTILVTTNKLGSINHTLLSLEILKQNNINLIALVFNKFENEDEIISLDTKNLFLNYITKNFPKSFFIELDNINNKNNSFTNENSLIHFIKNYQFNT